MILLRYKMVIYFKENSQKIFKFKPLKSLNKLHFVYFPISSIKPMFGTMKYYGNLQQSASKTPEKLSSFFKTNLEIAKCLFNTDLVVKSKHHFHAFSTDEYCVNIYYNKHNQKKEKSVAKPIGCGIQTRIIGFDPGCRKMLTGTALPSIHTQDTPRYYKSNKINKYSSGSKYYESTYINKSERLRKMELDAKWNEITIINTELSNNSSAMDGLCKYIK